MKKINLFFILLAFLIINPVFGIEEDRKVVSDSETQAELIKSFNEVNQYTDGLFKQKNTQQKIIDKKNEEIMAGKEYIVEGNNRIRRPNTLTPVKRLRLYLKENKLTDKKRMEENIKEAEENTATPKEQVILNCENMEYFADRTELEANGNVSMKFPQNDAVLYADKMIYNQTTNKITAVGHVIIDKGDSRFEGDYLVVNMNEENAIIDNPESDIGQIHAIAKQGFLYGDDIIQEQGSIYIKEKTMLKMRQDVYGPSFDNMFIPEEERSSLVSDGYGTRLKLKVSDILVNSKKEHDNVTVKKAEIYFKDKKVGTIPAMTIHTNKNRDYTLIDNPELGTMTNLGMYVGPGFVFDTPHGSALKLIPFFNYQSGGDRGSIGVGGFAKFRAATNRTDIAYGTANNTLLVDGLQYLDDNLFLQYGANRYIDDWFMGARMARMMGELVYQDSTLHKNFLAKKLDMTFSQRIAAGYMQDGPNDTGLGLFGDEGVGTFRGKYMAEINQTLFKLNDPSTDYVNAEFSLIGQGSFAVYGTGDTQGVFRFGPRFHHQYKRWMSDISYLVAGVHDGTPLKTYDRYVYGGSNVSLRESFRINKYLTASWLGSFNLSYNQERYKDSNIKLMPECAFFVAVGPDDLKLHIGYDVVRQQSFIYMTMDLDAKGMVVDYDKMIVKNPDNFNSKPKEILFVQNVPEDNRLENYSGDYIIKPESKAEHAEVTDIQYDERL